MSSRGISLLTRRKRKIKQALDKLDKNTLLTVPLAILFVVGFVGSLIAEYNGQSFLGAIFIGINILSMFGLGLFAGYLGYYRLRWKFRGIIPFAIIIFFLMISVTIEANLDINDVIQFPDYVYQIMGGVITLLILCIFFVIWRTRRRIQMEKLDDDE